MAMHCHLCNQGFAACSRDSDKQILSRKHSPVYTISLGRVQLHNTGIPVSLFQIGGKRDIAQQHVTSPPETP
jgi:hypothetical protein